jgi:hypothetical protein
MLALLAVAALETSWKLETTYRYVSDLNVSECQEYVFSDVVTINNARTLVTLRTLTAHQVDSLRVPLPNNTEPEQYVAREAQAEWVREPAVDDGGTYRLWRATLLPQVQNRRWAKRPDAPAATYEFRKERDFADGRQAIRFTFAEEGGMRGTGRAVCGSHGWAVEGEMTLENAFLPGGDRSSHKLTVKWRELR